MPNFLSLVVDWVSSHLVALGFAVFLAVAIYARGPLFGIENAPGPGVEALADSQAPSAGFPPAPGQLASSGPTVLETPVVPKAEPRSAEKPSLQKRPAAREESLFRPTEAVSKDHQQFVPMDEVKAAKRAERGPSPPAVTKRELDRLLRAARRAFWEGAPEQAESHYLRYLSVSPGDANVFGELGNLYQSMGRRNDALDAYFEAGVRFKASGDQGQLMQIVELLAEAGDPRLGDLRN